MASEESSSKSANALRRWKWPGIIGALVLPWVMGAVGGFIAHSVGGSVPVGVVGGMVFVLFLCACGYVAVGVLGSSDDS